LSSGEAGAGKAGGNGMTAAVTTAAVVAGALAWRTAYCESQPTATKLMSPSTSDITK
jgi:hypothetical protein